MSGTKMIDEAGLWKALPPEVVSAVRSWAIGNDYVGEYGHISYVYAQCAQVVVDALRSTPKTVQGGDSLDNQVERLTDLVRYQRWELFQAGLITQEEFAALVADSEGGERVARLEGWDAAKARLAALSDCPPDAPTEPSGHMQGGELRYIKQRYDFFWVFVPKHDAWRLGRCAGGLKAVVLYGDGLWVVHPDLDESWEAVGVEMPRHPRSVTIPKTAAVPALPGTDAPTELPARPKPVHMTQFSRVLFTADWLQYAEFKRYADEMERQLREALAQIAALSHAQEQVAGKQEGGGNG